MSTILLHGGSVGLDVNLGDALMLNEVLRRISSWESGGLQATIRPESGSYNDRAKLGLQQHMLQGRRNRLFGAVGYPVIKRYRKKYGITVDEDLAAVFNFMGYRYFDVGARETRIDGEIAVRQAQQGVPTILLPQAYGPFGSERIRTDAKKFFDTCALVYARDERSADEVESLGSKRPPVVPDVTIASLQGKSPRKDLKDRVCVVPNVWMVERVEKSVSDAYVNFISNAVKTSEKLGCSSFILCHAAFQDYELAKKIKEAVGFDIEIVSECSPEDAKAIIGECRLVIGSRYHALVAALSQNVPVIATSWAHKYEGLLSYYNKPEWLISPTDLGQMQDILEFVLKGGSLTEVKAHLAEVNKKAIIALNQMWDEVACRCNFLG